MDEQVHVEGRIEELESILKTAGVVEIHQGCRGWIGSAVKLKLDGADVNYEIVGANEADLGRREISNDATASAPRQKKGDAVEVETPGGTVRHEIVEVE
ncbi:MAG: GreA/GreB family elongation factor [Candidatus Andersenbacteria bacterium]